MYQKKLALRFFKPHPRYLTVRAEGRLLMLSPYPWQNEKNRKHAPTMSASQ
jgi:hypothetical protein